MLVAIAAMTVAIAGPVVEAQIIEPAVVETEAQAPSDMYFGFGYTFDSIITGSQYLTGTTDSASTFTQVGYNFNPYVAVEGRYSFGLETGIDTQADDTFAVYVKPQYPISADLTVYGLLGYAWSIADGDYVAGIEFTGFAYGLGAKYALFTDVDVFADYTNVYSEEKTIGTVVGGVDVDEDLYSINVGVTYKF